MKNSPHSSKSPWNQFWLLNFPKLCKNYALYIYITFLSAQICHARCKNIYVHTKHTLDLHTGDSHRHTHPHCMAKYDIWFLSGLWVFCKLVIGIGKARSCFFVCFARMELGVSKVKDIYNCGVQMIV